MNYIIIKNTKIYDNESVSNEDHIYNPYEDWENIHPSWKIKREFRKKEQEMIKTKTDTYHMMYSSSSADEDDSQNDNMKMDNEIEFDEDTVIDELG